MSSDIFSGDGQGNGDGEGGISIEEADPFELAERIRILSQENQRLREEYARSRRVQYHRLAIGFIAVGLLSTLGGLLFPARQTVLFSLGGTGLFIGILTYYLTPEKFIPVTIGREMYSTTAANQAQLTTELGLQDQYLYIPTPPQSPDMTLPVRLFIPQHTDYTVPDNDDLESHNVVTADESSRGVAFRPTGGPLLREFEQALTGNLGSTPEMLADQLTDGLVEQFELVESATFEVDTDAGRLTASITEPVYGPVDQFDHPVASFLGVGTAYALDTVVTVETTPAEGDRADFIVTCRWSPDASQQTPLSPVLPR